jgi:hypothetical protein
MNLFRILYNIYIYILVIYHQNILYKAPRAAPAIASGAATTPNVPTATASTAKAAVPRTAPPTIPPFATSLHVFYSFFFHSFS